MNKGIIKILLWNCVLYPNLMFYITYESQPMFKIKVVHKDQVKKIFKLQIKNYLAQECFANWRFIGKNVETKFSFPNKPSSSCLAALDDASEYAENRKAKKQSQFLNWIEFYCRVTAKSLLRE